MRGKFQVLLSAVTLGGAALMPFALPAQMFPDAPILQFRLPFFGESGYKTWELRGYSAEFVGPERVQIQSLDLRVFSGDARLIINNTIRSPLAIIHMNESRAEGESSLFVTGHGYEIEGADWLWEGALERLTVRREVRVAFTGSIDLLR